MKFNLDTAWKDATGLLSRNFGLLAVVAGVFFFLPNAGMTIAIPEMQELTKAQSSGNFEIMMAAVQDLYMEYWWAFLILAIVQGIGVLAMLALVRRRANPTVGEALGSGVRLVASYIAAQLLQTVVIAGVALSIVAVLALTGLQVLAALGAVAASVVALYLLVKFSLISPIIGIEGERSPVAAIRRSWTLTKGNSMRLFLFYVLLIVAFVVVSAVISLVLGLLFALAGSQAALMGEAVISGIANAAGIVLMVCVLAAIHTQLLRAEVQPSVPVSHHGED